MPTRQEEIAEFAGLLSALLKKYKVTMAISIQDIPEKPTEPTV